MSLAVFLVAVDGTVLSLATPSIVRDLQPSASQVLWIGDIYSFVLAGLLITMGNLGDRIGRKRLLMIGGGSKDPNTFSYGIFNFQRLTLAPILILAGYVVGIFSIMKKPKD